MSAKDVLKDDPRARQRLRWIEQYEHITKKVAPTCRSFGISRGTSYIWYHRYLSLGPEGSAHEVMLAAQDTPLAPEGRARRDHPAPLAAALRPQAYVVLPSEAELVCFQEHHLASVQGARTQQTQVQEKMGTVSAAV